MANYYISQSSGNNANDGSEATPFKTFKALTSLNFLAPGDNVNLLRNDEWKAGEIACDIQSSGDATGFITFLPYGSGNPPLLTGSPEYTAGWTLTSGTIYVSNSSYAASNSIGLVGIGSNDVLCRSTSYAAMNSGNYFYNSANGFVYAWLIDSSDPGLSTTYIGLTNFFIVKDSGAGNYIKYKNIQMRFINATGFDATGTNCEFYDCDNFGNAREGFHFTRNGIAAPGAQFSY